MEIREGVDHGEYIGIDSGVKPSMLDVEYVECLMAIVMCCGCLDRVATRGVRIKFNLMKSSSQALPMSLE